MKVISLLVGFCLIASTAYAEQGQLTSQERNLIDKLHTGNQEEVSLGRLAETKTQNPAVKDFAERMITDHNHLDRTLKVWASNEGVSLPTAPARADRAKRDLSKTAAASFDKKYVQSMLNDHEHDINELQNYLAGPGNPSLKSLIKSSLPVIENHLRLAENLAGELGIPPTSGLNPAQTTKPSSAG